MRSRTRLAMATTVSGGSRSCCSRTATLTWPARPLKTAPLRDALASSHPARLLAGLRLAFAAHVHLDVDPGAAGVVQLDRPGIHAGGAGPFRALAELLPLRGRRVHRDVVPAAPILALRLPVERAGEPLDLGAGDQVARGGDDGAHDGVRPAAAASLRTSRRSPSRRSPHCRPLQWTRARGPSRRQRGRRRPRPRAVLEDSWARPPVSEAAAAPAWRAARAAAASPRSALCRWRRG